MSADARAPLAASKPKQTVATSAPTALQNAATDARVSLSKNFENVLNAKKHQSGDRQAKNAPHAHSATEERSTVMTAMDAALEATFWLFCINPTETDNSRATGHVELA